MLTIRKRLILLAFASSVPLAGFAGLMAYRFVDREYVAARTNVADRTALLAGAVDRYLEDIVGNLKTLAASPALRTGEMAAFYRHAVEANDVIGGIGVLLVEPSGQQVVNTLLPFGADLKRRVYMETQERVLASGRPHVSNLVDNSVLGERVVSVEVPVTIDGIVRYVLVALVTPEEITDLLRTQQLPADWRVALVDRNGTIVSGLPDSERLIGQAAGAAFGGSSAQEARLWSHSVTLDDVAVYGSYRQSAFSGWTAAVGVPRAAIDAPYWQNVASAAGIAATIVVLSVAAAAVAASAIVRPLRALALAAEASGRGNRLPEREFGVREVDVVYEAIRDAGIQRDSAVRELEQTSRTLNAILATTDDPIYLIDQDKRYRYVGVAGARAIGRSPKEMLDRTWTEIGLPATAMASFDKELDEVLETGRTVAAESEYPAGTHWEYRLNPVRAGDGAIVGVVAASRDITQRKRTERALRESESRLKRAQEAGNVANWEWDPDTGTLWWSESVYGLLALDPIFIPSDRDFLQLVHADDRGRVTDALKDVVDGRSARLDSEFRVVWKDGTIRWIACRAEIEKEPDGRTGKLVGIAFDVSERKQAQLDLELREKYLLLVLDRLPVGIMQTRPDGRYGFVNSRFCELTGRSREELQDLPFAEITHPDDVAENMRLFRRAIEIGTPYIFRKRYIRPDQSLVWAEVTGTMLPEPGEGLLAVSVDLTERLRAEEHKNLLVDELNHRVKNTLAAVQSLAVMTMRHVSSFDAFKNAFVARLMALSSAHNLLTAGGWERASLDDLVSMELEPYAGRGRERLVISGEPLDLKPLEAISLGMIFHELATNAAKYGALSVPSGRVVVAWRVNPDSGRPHVKIDWREQRGPMVATPTRYGFGSRLIERSVIQDLGGKIELTYAPDGFRCSMDLRLDRTRGAERGSIQ
jgi:PAS domain S-box-containing protein